MNINHYNSTTAQFLRITLLHQVWISFFVVVAKINMNSSVCQCENKVKRQEKYKWWCLALTGREKRYQTVSCRQVGVQLCIVSARCTGIIPSLQRDAQRLYTAQGGGTEILDRARHVTCCVMLVASCFKIPYKLYCSRESPSGPVHEEILLWCAFFLKTHHIFSFSFSF